MQYVVCYTTPLMDGAIVEDNELVYNRYSLQDTERAAQNASQSHHGIFFPIYAGTEILGQYDFDEMSPVCIFLNGVKYNQVQGDGQEGAGDDK
jgi:hypothetical protein